MTSGCFYLNMFLSSPLTQIYMLLMLMGLCSVKIIENCSKTLRTLSLANTGQTLSSILCSLNVSRSKKITTLKYWIQFRNVAKSLSRKLLCLSKPKWKWSKCMFWRSKWTDDGNKMYNCNCITQWGQMQDYLYAYYSATCISLYVMNSTNH